MLNAFRHHRGGHPLAAATERTGKLCSTPFGITEVGIRRVERRLRAIAKCSTPFGITEVGIKDARAKDAALRVLNAFRHHRGGHIGPPSMSGWACRCSTPFGITEVGIKDFDASIKRLG